MQAARERGPASCCPGRVTKRAILSAAGACVLVVACSSGDTEGRLSTRRTDGTFPREAATSSPPSTTEAGAPAPSTSTPAPGTSADAGAKDAGLVEVQVSSLAFTETNGYGPVEKNTSNGEDGAGDGKPITLDNVVYATGLGVHAPSKVTFALGKQYKSFLADVGVDDEVMGNGSVVFQVVVDGAVAFDSGKMTGNTPKKPVSVDVANKDQLELVVTNADGGDGFDHADWANARLVK